MSAVDFMRNSFHLFVGALCWGGIILVGAVIVAVLIQVSTGDKKGDKADGK